ncbi:hypothetical protein M9Y10_045876 [Tritrichomonas musculus]|uniref:NIF system FeS cluster assembly NifU C-terminal domain-containing protein n=1 Tax=Tritrichomonas musculus TaxID=1915356 RepID=A0ABR2JWK8_9EUKA
MLTQALKSNVSTFLDFKRFFTIKINKIPNNSKNEAEKLASDDKIYKAADKIIEERIRPLIKADGGDVSLEDVKNGVLIVTLTGACEGCPSKNVTLYNGILGMVQDEVPGVIGIREKMDFDIFED